MWFEPPREQLGGSNIDEYKTEHTPHDDNMTNNSVLGYHVNSNKTTTTTTTAIA